MFGKKKSDDQPAVRKPSNKGSGKSFDPQEFLLMHVEKLLFGLIAIIAIGLIYLGASKEGFDVNKDPAKLSKQSQDTIRKIGEDHWDAIKNEEPRVKGITDIDGGYAGKTFESTKPMAPMAIGIDPGDPNRVRERRLDPDLLPAKQLEAKYFFGPIVDSSSNAQRVAIAEALNKLPDAKVKEEPKREPPRSGRNPPQGGRPPGMPGPGGGMPPGYASGPSSAPTGSKKFLAAGYDRGFPSHTLAPPSDKKKILVARDVGFVSVMALAPHLDLEAEYRNKLAKAGSVMPGRDTPYYVGYEVQRVDVTDDPSKQIQEADWQPLPNAGSEVLKERAKSSWLGTNREVVASDWTMQNLTMPVPPVLLKDYRPYITHSEIPKLGDLAPSAPAPGSSGQGESGDDENGGIGGPGMGSLGGLSGGGPPAGYGGGPGAGGPPAGYGGGPGAGGPPAGYGGGPGAGGPPAGYGGGPGAGGPPAGYGGGPGAGGMGGMGGMGGGSGTSFIPPTAETPKQLPSTKYKLVRFYDFETKANRIYRYRVRLLMYDPNFPEAASIQPRSSSLDVASGTLKRVQELLEKERKALESLSKEKEEGKTPYKRNSFRPTAWSEPSAPVSTVRSAEGYLGEPKIVYSTDKEQRLYETSPPRAEAVMIDWDPTNAIFIPRQDTVSRGYVFGLPNREGGKEAPIEIIHPISKVIKNLDDPKIKNLTAVIDLVGFANLENKIPKDPHLKSGGRGVAFDPESNRIIVLREFDDFGGFGMHTAPEKAAVGPLGGPLKTAAVAGPGGGFGGGMDGFGGSGLGGPNGVGPSGLGGPGGAIGGPGAGGGGLNPD